MAQNHKLYFLNQEYQPGMVYQQLLSWSKEEPEKLPIVAVIGIDVGHGECMADLYYKNSEGNWVPYEVNALNRIPSYLVYHGDQVIIGSDAKDLPGLITDIKKEPKDWDLPSADEQHTNKQVLQDFIAGLWKNVLNGSELVRGIKPEQLLVTVGCPASRSWTEPEHMRAYADLVKKATGYPNVLILPESTAAIMTPIYSNLKIDVGGGVAVYDFGSSTIDFTYILMGKVIAMASIRLGGYDIDKAMLRKVAKNHALPLSDADRMEYSTARTQLRIAKEKFYNTGMALENSITISKELDFRIDAPVLSCLQGQEDENQALLDMILRSHDLPIQFLTPKAQEAIRQQLQDAREEFLRSGEPADRSVTVKIFLEYTADKQMMRSVLEEDTAVSAQLEPPYKGRSWLDCVRRFFTETCDLLALKDLPCNAVILTGGTSNVTEVQQIADQYYPGKRRGGEADTEKIDTASSVSKGLSLVKGHEVQSADRLETLKTDIREAAVKFYDVFCENFAREKLYDRVWEATRIAAQDLNDGKTHHEVLFRVYIESQIEIADSMNQFNYDLRKYTRSFMRQKIQKYSISPNKTSCEEFIREKANSLAKAVYNTQVNALPEVSSAMLNEIADRFDECNIADVAFAGHRINMGNEVMWIAARRLHTGLDSVYYMMRGAFSSYLPPDIVAEIVTVLNDSKIKEQHRKDIGKRFARELKNMNDLRSGFIGLVEQQFEVALGIALFELFEEYICLY